MAAEALADAYDRYDGEFRRLAAQAKSAFETRDWSGLQTVARDRILLYPLRVAEVVVRLAQLSLWQPMPPNRVKPRFAAAIHHRPDSEIAKTFYNSAMRRVLGTRGVDHETEFLDLSSPGLPIDGVTEPVTAANGDGLRGLIGTALDTIGLEAAWADRARDVARIADRLTKAVPDVRTGCRLQVLPRPLVRNQRAFLVANLETDHRHLPLVISLVNSDKGGLEAEALLLTEDEAAIVFGFSRSYFQVEVGAPRPWIGFLRSLMPTKRIDELYTLLGYYKHGKREFYQQLQRMLAEPEVLFEPTDGVPGMVMLVFALKPMNSVFKVIKDRPDPPKVVSRREVTAKYRFVFMQEHGGRLADSQEFEGLALPRRAFAPSVLRELTTLATETVRESGDQLIFSQLFTERRMTPLDVYLKHAEPERSRAAVVDFGQAIKDLAGINIFPGDMLTKNFGVTRHGRMVFYDYDEITSVTDCSFRSMPSARSDEDEMAAEPWFPVREGDVFPEEWERFLRFPPSLHTEFLQHHRELFTPEYWRTVSDRVASGRIMEPAPFPLSSRLVPDAI